jgi:hypothetical protein
MAKPRITLALVTLLVWASASDTAMAARLPSNGYASTTMDWSSTEGPDGTVSEKLTWALEVDREPGSVSVAAVTTAEPRDGAANRLMKKAHGAPVNTAESHRHHKIWDQDDGGGRGRDDNGRGNNDNGRGHDDNNHGHDDDHHGGSGGSGSVVVPCAIGFGVTSLLFIAVKAKAYTAAHGSAALASSGAGPAGVPTALPA